MEPVCELNKTELYRDFLINFLGYKEGVVFIRTLGGSSSKSYGIFTGEFTISDDEIAMKFTDNEIWNVKFCNITPITDDVINFMNCEFNRLMDETKRFIVNTINVNFNDK